MWFSVCQLLRQLDFNFPTASLREAAFTICNAINASATFDRLGYKLKAELLLQCAGDGVACDVRVEGGLVPPAFDETQGARVPNVARDIGEGAALAPVRRGRHARAEHLEGVRVAGVEAIGAVDQHAGSDGHLELPV